MQMEISLSEGVQLMTTPIPIKALIISQNVAANFHRVFVAREPFPRGLDSSAVLFILIFQQLTAKAFTAKISVR